MFSLLFQNMLMHWENVEREETFLDYCLHLLKDKVVVTATILIMIEEGYLNNHG